MSAIMLFSITTSLLFLLPLMAQPLSLGLIIMLMTLMMCCLSALLISSWYGYILFLIYVGGLLVMFAYVAALSPNVLFSGGYPVLLFLLMVPLLFMIFYSYPFIDLSSLNYLNLQSNYSNLKTYGIELVSPEMISILIGLGLILLINLVVVVKICYYQHASLRPFKEAA
uniref:NADH-ubiquinone oxidoreductase chain 6 n=1 Tax=Aliger gigas TaxID=291982 RepID=A0A0U1V612_9CAEN|nr:NADH dehydrogenase subunit 6 [Aliger gigas]AIN37247.1 NADH dehydrogenase subunit 6 [Aliger gigas]QWL25115.1 NADH dehydrogenase subunit 6 [Aliger gigas]